MSTAALVNAIRDLSDVYQILQSAKPKDYQQMLMLEKQFGTNLGQMKISSSLLMTNKHNLLTHSNSVAIPMKNHREHKKLDRSISEPADRSLSYLQQQQPRPQNLSNSSRYKTELCRPFEESGMCKYGDKCQFAHGGNELRSLVRHPKYKTELCRTFHTTGLCPYGPRCHFIHNDLPRNQLPSTGSINISGILGLGNRNINNERHASVDFEIGSFSLGSTGELSPNSSSVSGSPTSSNGFYMEDSAFSSPVSPVPPPGLPPSSLFSGGSTFFDQDYAPFANSMPKTQDSVQSHDVRRKSSESVDVLSMSMENLNLADSSGSLYDVNRNLRLPIFSQFALPNPVDLNLN